MRLITATLITVLMQQGATMLLAQGNCSLNQAKGTYSASAVGHFLALPGPLAPLSGPTVRIGRVDNDGKGGVRVAAVASLNGFVFAEEYGGLLSVNPDCTSLVTFLIPLPGAGVVPFVFRGVLSDNHQQHDIILESIFGGPPASTVTISLRRQNRSNCSNNSLSGGYALTMRGFINTVPGPAAPFARQGRAVFDGNGGFSANVYATDGSGPLVPASFSGSYSMRPSCEFTMSYGGNSWYGVLMDNGAGANLMVSVPNPPGPEAPALLGAVVSGTLKKQ